MPHIKDRPEQGDTATCTSCGGDIVATGTAHQRAGFRGWRFGARHIDTGRLECDPDAWDAVDSAADYRGGLATWPTKG